MDTYTAWALHTGPTKPIHLWKGSLCPWVAGAWNGKDSIKDDIDERVDLIAENIQRAHKIVQEARKATEESDSGVNYFVVPEFYFHCKHGPYPAKRIGPGNELPFDYILSSLKAKIKAAGEGLINKKQIKGSERWVICAGSALTCDLPDIGNFLKSERVVARMRELNELLKGLSPTGLARKKMRTRRYSKRKRSTGGRPGNAISPAEEAENRIEEAMAEFLDGPLCVVRNRGVLLDMTLEESGVRLSQPWAWTYEKQNESSIDLTMGMIKDVGKKPVRLDPCGMIAEWMAGYPSVSIIEGDKNSEQAPLGARITAAPSSSVKSLELGVEICLDHSLSRLRRTVGMTVSTGASADNPPLDVQLIASGGMQIQDYSVAVRPGGAIFNSDGMDPIIDQYFSYGKPVMKHGKQGGTESCRSLTCGVYTLSTETMRRREGTEYYAHSQLAFRCRDDKIDDLGGYNNALGKSNRKAQTYNPSSGVNEVLDGYKLNCSGNLGERSELFVAGLGELHVYVNTPVAKRRA